MFDSKNAGGWALALVAIGLFLGLVSRDLVRKQPPQDSNTVTATVIPAKDERSRTLHDLSTVFERIASQYASVVVAIHAEPVVHVPSASFTSKTDEELFDEAVHSRHPSAIGSGVVMTPDGYILTNYHLVKNAGQVTVIFHDKRQLIGAVVGRDAPTDLAVVKIPAKDLKTARLGDSEALRPGQWVMALGNPFAERQAVTAGVVCVKGRSNLWLADFEDFLQTDAAITFYHDGGALVDLRGQLVGINTNFVGRNRPEGTAGLAIPINMAREIMAKILSDGKVRRATLAVVLQDLDDSLRRALGVAGTKGALVTEVIAGSSAAAAGVRRGDVIIKLGGYEIKDAHVLRGAIASHQPGLTVPMTVLRDGEEIALQVTLEERPTSAEVQEPVLTSNALENRLGLAVSPMTPAINRQLQLPAGVRGVLVSAVTTSGPANLAGIRAGDVVQEVNRHGVANLRDFRNALATGTSGDKIPLLIWRDATSRYCALDMP